MEWDDDAFAGGNLADVLAETMLTEDLRDSFKEHMEPQDNKALDTYAQVYGVRPGGELAEWTATLPAYARHFEDISDVWMLEDPLGEVDKRKKAFALDEQLETPEFLTLLLTGLERFGATHSGDTAYVSMMGGGLTAEVFIQRAEKASLDARFGSMASFIAQQFAPKGEDSTEWRKAAKAFDKRTPAASPSALTLFTRAQWLLPLCDGGIGDPTDGPQWDSDKLRAKEQAPLLHYWLLANYFLGNDAGCKEAITLAMGHKAAVTKALGEKVAALLDAPKKTKLGPLTPAELAKMRA